MRKSDKVRITEGCQIRRREWAMMRKKETKSKLTCKIAEETDTKNNNKDFMTIQSVAKDRGYLICI